MQFTHPDIEGFVVRHNMKRSLSKAIIDRVGGETEFLKKYRGYHHNDLTADISDETVSFYTKNKSDIHQEITKIIDNIGLDETAREIARSSFLEYSVFIPLIKDFIAGKHVLYHDHIVSAMVTYVNIDFAVGMELFVDCLNENMASAESSQA